MINVTLDLSQATEHEVRAFLAHPHIAPALDQMAQVMAPTVKLTLHQPIGEFAADADSAALN